jgi:curved DNA-binding protein CbpA
MQWIIATLLEMLIVFLESAFKQDPRFVHRSSTGTTNNDDDFYSNNPRGPGDKNIYDKKLQEAYTFMELTPPVTQEELKKRYKKLSLKYHPDRNQGSEESHTNMTKLNACFSLMEQELQGPVEERSHQRHDQNEEQEDAKGDRNEEDDDDHSSKDDDADDNFERTRQRWKQYEKIRKQNERGMKEEQKRYRKQRKEFHNLKRRDQKECRLQRKAFWLDTVRGRQAAHKSFSRQVQPESSKPSPKDNNTTTAGNTCSSTAEEPSLTTTATAMHDIDDHSSPEESKEKEPQTPSTKDEEKAKNPIMEYNSSDLMVALRMGMTGIALDYFEADLDRFGMRRTLDARLVGEQITPSEIRLEFLTLPVDDDGNTHIHYAVYYESYEMIQEICEMALLNDGLDKVIFQTNIHAETPLVFAKIAMDSRILSLVQSTITIAQKKLSQTQILPALKHAGQRLWGLIRHIDLVTTFNTCLSFYIGYSIFQLYNVVTLVGFQLMQLVSGAVQGIPDVTVLMIYYIFCKTVPILFHCIIQYIRWEYVILLGPIVMSACCGCCCASIESRERCSNLSKLILIPVPMFTILVTWLQEKITPKIITDRGLVKPFSLCICLVVSKGTKALISKIVNV